MINLASLVNHQDDVHKFITNMVEESKYCCCVMKKHFNKKLVMTKQDDAHFESSTKYRICDNSLVEGDVKVRDPCDIFGKYRGATNIDFNINVSLNYEIPIMFHNYGGHLIMQELGKFDFKINVIPNGLEKYMSFSFDTKLVVIDSFQFIRSSLDSLVNNLVKKS